MSQSFFISVNGFVRNEQPLRMINSEKIRVPVSKYEYLKEEIDNFATLENNWDGYGATPVVNNIVQSAKQLIPLLASYFIDHVTDVFPNPHGTITIEWENRKKEKLSLEIGENNYSYFVKYNNTNPKFINGENILTDLKGITSDLRELFREETTKYILSE
jgi:hypothetical protein